MIADKIKNLRETNKYTQAELAKKLGITRSSVNAWEMGISVPSTQYIVELSNLFGVSTDYLLCQDNATIRIDGLNEEDLNCINNLISHLKNKNKEYNS